MIKADKKKLFKAGIIFSVWLIAVFYIGSNVSQKSAQHTKENPKITEGQDATGAGLSDDQKTPEQKENTKKLNEINRRVTTNDLDKIAKALNPNGQFELIGDKKEDGVPVLRQYFPKGQDENAWNEALVFRSFVNIKIKNPVPVVYNIYDEWITKQVPDLKLNKTEENGGISFNGYSSSGRFFISGKVFAGSIDETVYIAQYIIKNDGRSDVEQKAKNWSYVLSQIK